MKSKRIVVYTAVCNDYDILRDPEYVNPECDYVCFCDRPSPGTSVWRRRPFDRYLSDPSRTTRRVKLLPHLYFRDYEISLWIDGNITIVGDVLQLAHHYLAEAPIAMYGHPEGRTCIYEEAEACLQQEQEDGAVIHAQREHYKNRGYPAKAGLHATFIILRRHGDPLVVRTMEDWWRELLAFSRRDQLSFDYVAYQNHINVATIKGNIWTETDQPFLYSSHANRRKPQVKSAPAASGAIESLCALGHSYERAVDIESGDSLSKLARSINPGSCVLELGPAMGYFTKFMTESLHCTVDCVEISEKMAATAAPHARTMWVGDLDEITLADRFTENSYDYVIAADVLEHLKNPWRTLAMCRSMLKASGRLLVSLPNIGHAALVAELLEGRFDYRDEGLLDRTHLRFFTRHGMLDLFRRTGYRIETVDSVSTLPEHTEFHRALDELPPYLRSALLRPTDALTYQFIVVSTPGEMTDAEWEELAGAEASAQPYFCATVYWATADQGFSEERSVCRHSLLGYEHQQLQFDFPIGAQVRHIRLHPADRPGYVHLYALRLTQGNITAGNGTVREVLALESAHEIAARAVRLDGLVFCPSALRDTFLAVTNNPQFTIELSETLSSERAAPLTLEVIIDWPMSPDYLVACAQCNKVTDDYQRALAGLKQKTETIGALGREIEDARVYQTQSRSRIASLEGEQARREAEIRDLRRQVVVGESTLATIYGSREWKMLMACRAVKHGCLQLGRRVARMVRRCCKGVYLLLTSPRECRIHWRRWRATARDARAARVEQCDKSLGMQAVPAQNLQQSITEDDHNLRQQSARTREVEANIADGNGRPEVLAPLVSIVVICWNNKRFLKRCFDALMNTDYPNLEIFLADNASTDGSPAFVAEHYPTVRIIVNPTNLGFAEGNNRAIRQTHGKYIVTLNPDTEVDPHWLMAMVEVAESDDSIGMVSPKMYIMDRDRLLNSAGGDMLMRSGDNLARAFYLEDDGRFGQVEETFGPSAGAGLYRRAMIEDIGLFDRGLFTYYEDVDLNMRAQLRGYRCMYVPRAVVQHYQAGTLDDHNPFKTFLLQRNKWYVVLKTFPLGLLWHCRRDLARSYVGAMLHVRSLPGGKKLVWRIHRSLLKHLPRIFLLRCLLAWRRKPGATRRIARWMDRHNATYRELDQAAAVGRYYEDLRRRVDARSDR